VVFFLGPWNECVTLTRHNGAQWGEAGGKARGKAGGKARGKAAVLAGQTRVPSQVKGTNFSGARHAVSI